MFKINQIVRVMHTRRGDDGEYGPATLCEGVVRGTATLVGSYQDSALTSCYMVELPEALRYQDPMGGYVKHLVVHPDNLREV